MDKTLKYQKAIIELLEFYKNRYNQDEDDGTKHYVFKDKENHHYQLIIMGFDNRRFIHNCIFHFDIRLVHP